MSEIEEIRKQERLQSLKIPIKREPGLVFAPTGETCVIMGKTYRILELVRVNEKGYVIS